MKFVEGVVAAPNARIAVSITRFNHFINDSLLSGAIDTLKRIGQVKDENISVFWVPGAYELPLIVKALADTQKYNAIVALGTIIHGSTRHFKLISNICSTGLSTVSLQTSIPVAFGVLTTNNVEQAIERAGAKAGNKGMEAALTILEMINLLQAIKS